ncbi:helix-turn-helix domain-containing protein [Bradyrhizobium cenepequi]|uniref:helix-turn-helix domain-containing protein n=1 Tax=Bradyrhizobium cenepequi TaxID=2821403 RepID=UPI0035D7D50C
MLKAGTTCQTGPIELEAAMSVATHRNFRATAEELAMSRTAVNSPRRGLEARIVALLFQRTTRSATLSLQARCSSIAGSICGRHRRSRPAGARLPAERRAAHQ